MELIPILSLIILVATISTFILAVGAYVLYKIRERKGRVANAPQPAAIEAELVAPSAFAMQQQREQFTSIEEQAPTRVSELAYQRQSVKTQERTPLAPPMRPTFIGNAPDTRYTEEKYIKPREEKTRDERVQNKKFMRYTTEGSEENKKTQERKEDKLRWR